MGFEKPLTGAERTARRRAKLRAQGLKPHTFWLPELTPERLADIAAQCKRINKRASFEEDMAFIESVRYWPEDEYDWGPDGPP